MDVYIERNVTYSRHNMYLFVKLSCRDAIKHAFVTNIIYKEIIHILSRILEFEILISMRNDLKTIDCN